jgi:hypothetical protein
MMASMVRAAWRWQQWRGISINNRWRVSKIGAKNENNSKQRQRQQRKRWRGGIGGMAQTAWRRRKSGESENVAKAKYGMAR